MDTELLIHLQFHTSVSFCPYCGGQKLHIKDYRNQKILLGHWDFSPIFALSVLVEESGVDEFNRVLKTFKTWKAEIQVGLTNVYSNGMIEGMNNKIRVFKKTSFGFRDFHRFQARILWLFRVKQQSKRT